MRAYVQHRPTPPWKVWYVAPNFRYERAQKGRYRQHWQLGVEVLGVDDPAVDVEVIALLDGFYRDLGLTGVTLALNSMGDAESRPALRRRAAATTSSTTPTRSAPSSASGSRRTRCGCSTRRCRTGRTSSSARRSSPSTSPTTSRAALRAGAGGAAGARHQVRARAAARARLRLLHAHHVRVPERRARRGAERARRRRALRRAGRGDGRPADARASASAPGSSGSCIALEAQRIAGRRPRGSTRS